MPWLLLTLTVLLGERNILGEATPVTTQSALGGRGVGHAPLVSRSGDA